MFATGIFKTGFMLFLLKNKKWMPSHFWFNYSWTPSILHNIFVWSYILKIDNDQVQNRSFSKNVENVLRPTLSCINLRMDDVCKNHQVLPSL